MERVFFRSDGVELIGELGLYDPDGPPPGLVLSGPLTGVEDQVTGRYTRRLTAAGYATLAFDHRGFDESGGARGHQDTPGKPTGLRTAVGVLAGHDRVHPDRIGLVDICLGAGYAVRAAATDPQVRAVVGVADASDRPIGLTRGMDTEASGPAGRGPLSTAAADRLHPEAVPPVDRMSPW